MPRFAYSRTIIAIGFALLGSVAQGQLITNGGFESPGFTPSPSYYKYLHTTYGTQDFVTGWNFAGTVQYEASYLMRLGGPYDIGIGAGNYGLLLNEGAVLSTTFAVTSGTQYQVSFIAYTNATLVGNALRVTADGNLATFTPAATFTTYSYNFTAGTTGTVGLSFEVDSTGSAPLYAYLDSVSVTAVPEPATVGLLAGVLGLGVAWMKRRRPAA